MCIGIRLQNIYDKLLIHYGNQDWWPADSRLECAIGAILTQNTSWKNVEKAISNIKSHMDITSENLTLISTNELSELIKPSGFYNQKAARMKRFIHYINNYYGGEIETMMHEDYMNLRRNLLKINGIGPETADCILLYALDKPVFVIDRYTYRLLYRHDMIEKETDYTEMQKIFLDNIERNTELYGEFHALIVKVGKKHCRKRANCDGCPIDFDSHKLSGEII